MDYLYRVRIIAYPEGAIELCYDREHGQLMSWMLSPGWKPPGWEPANYYIDRFGTTDFVWPSTKPTYRSRSTAKKRAQLIESFGATVVIERASLDWKRTGGSERLHTITLQEIDGHYVPDTKGRALLFGVPEAELLEHFDAESRTWRAGEPPRDWSRQARRRAKEAAAHVGVNTTADALEYWALKDGIIELTIEYE